jgi:hypothetical protein
MLSETQLFLVFIGVILLVNVLIALIDWRWGRGIAFTALALLALAFSVFISVVFLQAVQQSLDKELADPQSWASLGVGLGTAVWSIIEVPVVLGLGLGAILLAALSRQRGWIIANTIALLSTIAASLVALKITEISPPAKTSSIHSPFMRQTCDSSRHMWRLRSCCSRSNSSTSATACGASGTRCGWGVAQLHPRRSLWRNPEQDLGM